MGGSDRSRGTNRRWRPRRLSIGIIVAAVALAGGMFTLSNNVTQHDQQRLLIFQAGMREPPSQP